MFSLGLACFAGLILYVMFVLLEFLDSKKTADETNDSQPLEIETPVQ